MNTFFSYSHLDSEIALQLAGLCWKSLAQDFSDELFVYSASQKADQSFLTTINNALTKADAMVRLASEVGPLRNFILAHPKSLIC